LNEQNNKKPDQLATGANVATELLTALGLPHGNCESLELKISAREPVSVKVSYLVRAEKFDGVDHVLRQYTLAHRDDFPVQKMVIWDLDNCLADDKWRQDLIEWDKVGDERYEVYNNHMCGDNAHNVDKFKAFVAAGLYPVFFTGRAEHFRGATAAWIRENLCCEAFTLFMRPSGTVGVTPAALKERMLDDLFSMGHLPSDIVAAFDDLQPVIDMYRSRGVNGVHLQIHDPAGAYDAADLGRKSRGIVGEMSPELNLPLEPSPGESFLRFVRELSYGVTPPADLRSGVVFIRLDEEEVQDPEPSCSSHPCAPHGFMRDASHAADQYVCECAGFDRPNGCHGPVTVTLVGASGPATLRCADCPDNGDAYDLDRNGG
jgi:hypothetical protein